MKAPDYLKRAVREERGVYIEDSELLSVLLSIDPEAAREILSGHSIKDLARCYTGAQLQPMLGITEHQASVLAAGLMLGRRAVTYPDAMPTQISCAADAANVMIPLMDSLDQEELWVLTLNTKNRVMGKHHLYRGTVDSTNVRVAEVLRPAVLANAPAIVMVHNHPSGDVTPSAEDVQVTADIMAAGHLLRVKVLDHIVVSGNRYSSMKERGLC